MLGASGVTHAPLQTIGVMNAFSSADGSFTDAFGLGQFDSDSDGYLYVGDTTNNRVQRFIKGATGLWSFDSKCSATNALGSNVTLSLVAVDRARNQIHLASSAQTSSGSLVGVWDLASWPSLTVANRNRSYGTAAGSNGSGNLRTPMTLTIVGDFSILCSSAGDYRVIKYNHTTGALVAEDTNSLWKARFAANADGSKYYSGAQATDTELGLWEMNTSTLAGVTRLDYTTGGSFARRGSLQQGAGGDASDLVYYSGRVYVRGFNDGRIQAWNTSDGSFSDEFALAGGAGTSESFGSASGFKPSNIQQMKIGVTLGASDESDDLIAWASSAQNTSSQQSFLLVWPLSTSTATWTKNDFSTGTNTLQSVAIQGTNISAEKFKIRLKKNSGSFVTVLGNQMLGSAFTSAISGLGTFTDGDTLTVELSLSTHDRLDGHSTLVSVRDKLTPSNVSLLMGFDDSSADVFVPYATPSFRAKMSAQGAFLARLDN